MDVKPLDVIVEKWDRVTPTRTPDYTYGVEHPRRDWARTTIASEDAYEAGIMEAVAAKRFGRGVAKRGTEGWQDRTLKKGPQRWIQGVRIATPDYANGFAPFRDELERIDLPPRGPVNSPQNYDRVNIIGTRLHALKIRLMGG